MNYLKLMSIPRAILAIGLLSALTACGNAEPSNTYAADYAKLKKQVRIVLCGQGTMDERAHAMTRIVESPLFDDRRYDAQDVYDAAGEIEKEGCPQTG